MMPKIGVAFLTKQGLETEAQPLSPIATYKALDALGRQRVRPSWLLKELGWPRLGPGTCPILFTCLATGRGTTLGRGSLGNLGSQHLPFP